MPTYSANINVDQITCQAPGCSSGDSPASLIVVNAFLNADGYMYASGTRLPAGWTRMTKMDDSGKEQPFRIYCPACAASL